MTVSPWQRRINRAQGLAREHPFAAEILGFYIHVARFQEDLHQRLSAAFPRQITSASIHAELNQDELGTLRSRFDSFLSVAETHGPKSLAELSRELRTRHDFWSAFLQAGWIAHSPSAAKEMLVLAFLQPYANWLVAGTHLKKALTINVVFY